MSHIDKSEYRMNTVIYNATILPLSPLMNNIELHSDLMTSETKVQIWLLKQ